MASVIKQILGESGEPLKPGQRVKLKKVEPCDDFPEGLPEELGVLVTVDLRDDTCTLQVDDKFVHEDEGDDGLRECDLNMVEPIEAPGGPNKERLGASKLLMTKIHQKPWDNRN